MHQPQTKKKKAFTLVELIIVITILAILGTIAFISFQGYTKDTRDSVRLTDVKSIYDGLSIYKIQTSTTLLPDDYIEIQSGTTTISYQGYAGDTVQRGINLKNGGTDPLSKNYYIYTTDVSAKKIQLMTYLETADKDVELLSYNNKLDNLTNNLKEKLIENNLIDQAYSANTDTGYYEDKKIYVYGDKIGILTDENNVPLQETITSTGINLVTNTGNITTYFGGYVYDGGKSTSTGTTLINEINGAINNTLPCSPTTYEGYSITSLQDSQSGSFTKPLTIDYGSGTGTIIATCSNGILSYSEPNNNVTCNDGYLWDGSSCLKQYDDINYSLRFNGTNNYLTRSQVGGDRLHYTFSVWVKRSILGGYQTIYDGNTGYERMRFDTNNKLEFIAVWDSNTNKRVVSNTTFNQIGKWYHIVGVYDGDNPTQTEKIRLYIDGVRETSFSFSSFPTGSVQSSAINNNGYSLNIGSYAGGSNYFFNGYLSEFNFINGQTLSADNFGVNIGGKWLPKTYTGSYGTNGFHLDFSDNTNLGKDISGNLYTFTYNQTSIDRVIDTPTNNFPILNILNSINSPSITNGGLNISGNNSRATATLNIPTNGKRYREMTPNMTSSVGGFGIIENVSVSSSNIYTRNWVGKSNGGGNISYGGSWSSNQTLGILLDLDNREVSFTNGITNDGVAFTGIPSLTWLPYSEPGSSGTHIVNFGQGGQSSLNLCNEAGGYFKYCPPAGYKALSSKNTGN